MVDAAARYRSRGDLVSFVSKRVRGCPECQMRATEMAASNGGHWSDYYPPKGIHLAGPNDVVEGDPGMVRRTILIFGTALVFLVLCGVATVLLMAVTS